MIKFKLLLTFFLPLAIFSCGDVQTTNKIQVGGLRQPCYDDYSCNEGLTCVSDVCVDLNDIADTDNVEIEDHSDPDIYDEPVDNIVDDNNENGCDIEEIGKSCSLDEECGKCNICIKGKCSKGCESDSDCRMYTGLKCNKNLNRCVNVYASLQACGETKCPIGCCYAMKGLQGVKCLTTPEAAKCGLCENGELFMPEESKCVPAVCSTTNDLCPNLNASSTDPDPECFECKSGEFICREKTNCSSLTAVKANSCKPAGEKCEPGLMSNCCSGLPCVDGYCY